MAICGRPATAGGASNAKLQFTYTGDWTKRTDGVVELRSTGTLVFLEPAVIDLFLVGGGGAGGYAYSDYNSAIRAAGGGGGGNTATLLNTVVNGVYTVTIGAGGTPLTSSAAPSGSGGKTSFGSLLSVDGGFGGYATSSGTGYAAAQGGSGGSGGGAGAINNTTGGAGGSNGGDGETGYVNSVASAGGTGQGNTTKEFGEDTGKTYAGGGGGGRYISSQQVTSAGGDGGGGHGGWCISSSSYILPESGMDNTGSGGGGGVAPNAGSYPTNKGAAGGSGIVCFREAVALPELEGTWVLNERLYAPESNISQYTNFAATFGSSTIDCTRAQVKTDTVVITSDGGRAITIYTFASNTWASGSKYKTWTFPAGATASDEFRAWLASNATKQ